MSLESDSSFAARSQFYQGSYTACISTIDSIGSSASEPLKLYAARSQIALGALDKAHAIVDSLDTPAARAVKFLADFSAGDESAPDEIMELLDELAEEADGPTRAVAGTVLANVEDYRQQAIETLTAGAEGEDQECVALLVQLYLSMDRIDLAKQTYDDAKVWAEDSLLIQLCEAWIGLKQGGEDDGGYQTAFYCYDEMSQLPSANNPVVLNGKAIAQAAMHRWPEAEAPLQEAAQIDANSATTLANLAGLAVLSGKPAGTGAQYIESLKSASPSYPLLQDIAAKEALFEEAASKFTVSASA